MQSVMPVVIIVMTIHSVCRASRVILIPQMSIILIVLLAQLDVRLVPLQVLVSLARLGITCQGRHVLLVVVIALHVQQQDALLAMRCQHLSLVFVTCALM